MKFAISAALLAAAISAGEAEAERLPGDFGPRDYAPRGYDVGYSRCPDESDMGKHLDTPKYQALSAECKKEIIWARVN